MATKICKRCGREFTTEKNAQKFCSKYCTTKYLSFGAKQTEFKCAFCGKNFTSQKKKKYCSDQCRLKANGRLKNKKKADSKPKNFMSIEEVARESRKLGISAGEYMQKFCYGKEGA